MVYITHNSQGVLDLGGAGIRAPLLVHFLFLCSFGQIWSNNTLVVWCAFGLVHPLWEILDPPLTSDEELISPMYCLYQIFQVSLNWISRNHSRIRNLFPFEKFYLWKSNCMSFMRLLTEVQLDKCALCTHSFAIIAVQRTIEPSVVPHKILTPYRKKTQFWLAHK